MKALSSHGTKRCDTDKEMDPDQIKDKTTLTNSPRKSSVPHERRRSVVIKISVNWSHNHMGFRKWSSVLQNTELLLQTKNQRELPLRNPEGELDIKITYNFLAHSQFNFQAMWFSLLSKYGHFHKVYMIINLLSILLAYIS